ncbi:transcriptional antiterminator NusG [Paenibacillus shirakamiensis]|uniref:Transcription termination/antitermination protein NusG n=1 Tax=Paenibacillus shirakamiensis TaxID=1265935 RepID=A0ABS4JEQ7_9BACL|nr:antiterminator LoaP [Paenibacillus shirakamiensis]MBP2000183.1 transcriptional antiterminator NusG [Paenibacillus shirakamiensis]
MGWYALFVQSGKEEWIRSELHKKFGNSQLECLIPKRTIPEKKNGRYCDVTKKMFPGYILLHIQMDFPTYYKINQIPMIYRLLNYHNLNLAKIHYDFQAPLEQQEAYFKAIPDEEVAQILKLIGPDETLGYSSVLIENSKVIVKSGPLKDMESIIKKIDKHKKRAKIMVRLFEKEVMFDVGLEILYGSL